METITRLFYDAEEIVDVKMKVSYRSSGMDKRNKKPFSNMKRGKFRRLFNRYDHI
jgi:hypothetical protein